MIVEVVGELFSNSLAILTKITNSLLNIANFAIVMFATWKVGWKTAPHQSFEFYQLHIDYKHLFLYKLYD
jgi:Co/Zn/Cd efflux system component